MDTFNTEKRLIKNFTQFVSAANKISKTDKKKHKIVTDGYSGEQTGKKGVEVLDNRQEEHGKHDTVKASMSGAKKGQAGIETLDDKK